MKSCLSNKSVARILRETLWKAYPPHTPDCYEFGNERISYSQNTGFTLLKVCFSVGFNILELLEIMQCVRKFVPVLVTFYFHIYMWASLVYYFKRPSNLVMIVISYMRNRAGHRSLYKSFSPHVQCAADLATVGED